jgi:hypothetical protein
VASPPALELPLYRRLNLSSLAVAPLLPEQLQTSLGHRQLQASETFPTKLWRAPPLAGQPAGQK